jgi:hypothetical protein
MRCLPLVIGAVAVAFASGASAQSINLTGTYRCIQDCRDGYLGAPAFAGRTADSVRRRQGVAARFRASTAARWLAQSAGYLGKIARFEPDQAAHRPGASDSSAGTMLSIFRSESLFWRRQAFKSGVQGHERYNGSRFVQVCIAASF